MQCEIQFISPVVVVGIVQALAQRDHLQVLGLRPVDAEAWTTKQEIATL
jgi:hypothetical protein